MHQPGTAASCKAHALREAKTSAEYAAGMWAACRLMSMHIPSHKHFLEEQARAWSSYTRCTDRAPGWPGFRGRTR